MYFLFSGAKVQSSDEILKGMGRIVHFTGGYAKKNEKYCVLLHVQLSKHSVTCLESY